MTGPFGETLPVQPATPAGALAPSVQPNNTAPGTTYSYVGQHEKLTESNYLLTPIQMGARVYLPTLGRFTAVDPTEGGTDNNYAYANDPVNEFDLSGNIVETAADVAGVAYDIHEMYKKPSWGNAGMLAWSVAAAIVPFVPGSYAGRAGAAAFKAAKGAAPVMAKKTVQTQPKNLVQKLTLDTVRANPAIGKQIMRGKIKDPKYSSSDWRKMQYTHRPLTAKSQSTTVHYFFNIKTQSVKQLKIVNNKKRGR